MRATPHSRTRGRPSQGAQPAQIVSTLAGALASSIAARPPLVDPQRCVILAPNERDETLWPPQELTPGVTVRLVPCHNSKLG